MVVDALGGSYADKVDLGRCASLVVLMLEGDLLSRDGFG